MFKKRKLGLALSAVMAGGLLASGTQAVTLTPDGLGDAALFSYYTVNGNWQTFFRLINTSDKALAVKLRFREAANSREVLDFVVFLSPHDMWHAWTDADALMEQGEGPGIRTSDTSCIYPLPDTTHLGQEGWQTLDNGNIAAAFKDRAFTGAYSDNAAKTSLERMSEGHLEVIGLAEYDPNSGNVREANLAAAVTHNAATGKPNDCQAAANLLESTAFSDPIGTDMSNALAANAYLINVSQGLGAGYDPTMLYDFADYNMEWAPVVTDLLPDLGWATPVTAGGDWLYNGGFNSSAIAWNQLDHTGTLITIPTVVGVYADLNNDGDIVDTWMVDLNGDGDCLDAGETIIEGNTATAYINNAQWAALGNGAVTTNIPNGGGVAGTCYGIVTGGTPITYKSDVTVNSTARIGQWGRFGTQAIWGGVDWVSSLLMRSSVINEWAAKATPGRPISDNYTQWVINFPTKNFYVDLATDPVAGDDVAPLMIDPDPAANNAWAPFSEEFDEGSQPGTSCEPFAMNIWNREERNARFTSPGPSFPTALCWETNVVTFHERYNDAGLDSNFATAIPSGLFPTDAPSGEKSGKGWAELQFLGAGTRIGLSHNTAAVINPFVEGQWAQWHGHKGLPVDGFMLTVFNTNSTANNHAMINSHKYVRDYANDNR